MTQSRCWSGWGVRIQLEGPAALLQGLPYQVPPGGAFVASCDSPSARFRWDAGRHLWVRYPGREGFLDLEGALALEVATHSPHFLFIHAGAVLYRKKALVLPGLSRAGKSTLVEALVRRGAVYFSDEYAVFHPDGLVLPYPRRLSLRSTTERPQAVSIPPEQLGWESSLERAPLGWLIDCRYTGQQRLQPITPGESLLALFANAVAARSRARDLLGCLSRALVGVPGLRGWRTEAAEAADWILHWMSA